VLLPYLLGLATPAAAAVLLTGPSSLRAFLRNALRPASVSVCGVASSAQAGLLATVAVVATITGGSELPRWSAADEFALLALGQIWVVLGEEIGWRGYALPRLLRLGSARAATLVLAVAWGVWHTPMFFVSESLQAREPVWLFAAAVFAWTSIHSALYLRARPSIVPNLVLHASANLTLNLVLVPASAQPTLAAVYAVAGVLVWLRLESASSPDREPA
jgi:membrane protease YdiL (CAAX protease family)